jgi:cytochrome P450
MMARIKGAATSDAIAYFGAVQTGALVHYDPFAYDIHDDPYPVYRRLRDEAPVWRNEEQEFWTLSRYDDVLQASVDWTAFSSAEGTTLERVTGEMIISMDPPDHTRLRRLVSRAFTPRRIAELESFIRRLTRRYLEPLGARGEADVVRDLSARLPINVISELMGLPDEHRETVRELSDQLLHREPDQRRMERANLDAGRDLGILVWGVVDERRRRGPARNDADSDLIDVLIEADLSDAELIGFCLLLAVAGNETVTKLVANAAIALHRFPAQRELLLADPGLIPNAVEETLRWDAPSQFQGRTLTRDVELHGVTMPAGDFVLLLTGSANRDEREYDQPERFDVRRLIERPLGFGHGPHVCLGAALARMETRVAIEELLRLFPDFVVDESRVVRMHSSNVRGLSSVPISFTARG